MNIADFYEIEKDKITLSSDVPYKNQLQDIFDLKRKNEKGEVDEILPYHMAFIIQFCEYYCNNEYNKLCEDRVLPSLTALLSTIGEHHDKKDLDFLKIAALYHDIGKHIEVDNHPQIGTYILNSFHPSDKKSLLAKMKDYDGKKFALLLSIIKHHDKFGVVQTGEASYSIFSDLPYHASNVDVIDAVRKNIAYVCLINIFDMAAYVVTDSSEPNKKTPMGVKQGPLSILHKDFSLLIDKVNKSDSEIEKLKQLLMELDCKSHIAIERINRLLHSSTNMFPSICEKINIDYLTAKVPTALQCQFPEFANNFAHIVKLDYGLRFFQSLVFGICKSQIKVPIDFDDYNQAEQVKRLNEILKSEGPDTLNKIRDSVTGKVLKILERFALRYKWALQSTDYQNKKRIGYEMKGIISNPRIKKTIIDSLIGEETESAALNWIVDKTTIWSFD